MNNKRNLLKISIQKAIQNNDIFFLEELIDQIDNEILEDLNLEDYLILALYEYSNKNYQKAKYLASLEYYKNSKQAQLILDMIDINMIIERAYKQKDLQDFENEIITFLIKKSQDLFSITFLILRYIKYMIDKSQKDIENSIIKLINQAIQIYPKGYNLYILKIYVLQKIFEKEIEKEYLEYVLSLLPNESKEVLIELLRE